MDFRQRVVPQYTIWREIVKYKCENLWKSGVNLGKEFRSFPGNAIGLEARRRLILPANFY